ncbi:MAG: hypothetical protein EB127_26935, partial [Alphaproteobacteria bacterium]|nr:hypothetical protein [Alphaproteobacteria bacterium]
MSNLEQARKQNAITRRREEKMGFHGMRAFEIAMNLAGHGRNLDPELAAAAIEYDVNKESQKEAQKEARLEAQKEAIRECCPLNLSQTQSPAPLRILTGYSILRTPCPPLNLSQT